MTWRPIDLAELESRIAEGLRSGSDDLRQFYRQISRVPARWTLHPWGDPGGGFWVVAVHEGRVLWFNDIEDGFNVSDYVQEGVIPSDQYWCNQDEVHWALKRLRDGGGHCLGPPRSPGQSS